MKTPEEIKKGLECCHVGECECSKCPYEKKDSCMHYLKQDALTYIRHIEKKSKQFEACYKKVSKALCGNENKSVNAVLVVVRQLKSRLAQVKWERDAAVYDINRCCGTCKHFQNEEDDCTVEECIGSGSYMEPSGWQWRGVCPENTKEDSK